MAHILVIDDDRSVRHLIAKAFEDSDVQIVPAATAEEGMQLLDQRPVRCRAARHHAARVIGPRPVRADSRGRLEAAGDLHHVAFEQRNGDQGDDARRVRLFAQAARPGADSRPGSPGDGNPPVDEHPGRHARRSQRARKRRPPIAATRWWATARRCRKSTKRSAAWRRRT